MFLFLSPRLKTLFLFLRQVALSVPEQQPSFLAAGLGIRKVGCDFFGGGCHTGVAEVIYIYIHMCVCA